MENADFSQSVIMMLNLLYSLAGSMLAIMVMIIAYKIFDRMTPFDTARELAGNNTAVAIVVGSIFISLGISIGLVIGLGLN
ncbi:DUF350 domain-containing protein [Desulfobacterales bacterium HSG16]|nr:DUF350 domain-containing protein [Desulfobacterales bacterium HSG16]